MATNWEVLNAFNLPSEDPSSKSRITARITTTTERACLMFDLRTYNGDKPTKIGVAVHLPELKWLFKTLNEREEGSLDRPHRIVSVSRTWFGTRFTVTKKKINTSSEITLYTAEMEVLKKQLPEIISYMEQKSLEFSIPIDFVAGERKVEVFPK